jgi:hypothetical protein
MEFSGATVSDSCTCQEGECSAHLPCRLQFVVYDLTQVYTRGVAMSRALTRTNLLLESGKVQQLRKTLHSRSNSEAVRRVIEERLAVEAGLGALRTLRELGGPEDVFGRASAKKK